MCTRFSFQGSLLPVRRDPFYQRGQQAAVCVCPVHNTQLFRGCSREVVQQADHQWAAAEHQVGQVAGPNWGRERGEGRGGAAEAGACARTAWRYV